MVDVDDGDDEDDEDAFFFSSQPLRCIIAIRRGMATLRCLDHNWRHAVDARDDLLAPYRPAERERERAL